MKSRFLAVSFLFLAAMAIPRVAKAPPPMTKSTQQAPGASQGKATSYWLAPYIKVSQEQIGKHSTQTVTWYSEDGSAKTQIVDAVDQGYATTRENGQKFALGIHEPWKVELPKKPDDLRIGPFPGATKCTPDSRTLIRPFTPEPGQTAIDVYAHGVLTKTLGPFVRHEAQEFQMNDDGSMAILIYKDASKTASEVLCADGDGGIQFRVDCDNNDTGPIPAPNAAAAIFHDRRQRKYFTCYTRAGKGASVELSENAHFIGWVPGSLKSLFTTSLKIDNYHMIDWESGKELWNIPCPGDLHAVSITITPRFVIFLVAERYKGYYTGGGWGDFQWMLREGEEPLIRAFYAASVEDGHLVSRWQANFPRIFTERDRPRLMQTLKKLYFLTAEEFSEINEEDILAGRNGWKPLTAEK